jgi:glycolate oxidase FAD binding subunit
MKLTDALLPGDEEDAAAMIRTAFEKGTPLEVAGGATRRGIGRPVQAEATISSVKMQGIVHYDPAEMVMVVKAGTQMTDIEKALTRNGQRLAFEPADLRGLLDVQGRPTIGAVAATNNSGPRRYVAGAARDSLLGVRFVNGSGEIVKSGGRVMKNVTGLDLVKLMAGSWGTLGFLSEVTFKVLPRAETETTLALRGLLDADAVTALAHAMATTLDVSGAAHLPEMVAGSVLEGRLGSEPATLMRIEGFENSVAMRAAKLKEMFSGAGPVDVLGADQSAALWSDIRDVVPFADATQRPVWKVSMAPSRGHQMVMALRMQGPVSAYYDWQGGLVWLRMEDGEAGADELRALVGRHGGGHATLVRGPSAPASRGPDGRVTLDGARGS